MMTPELAGAALKMMGMLALLVAGLLGLLWGLRRTGAGRWGQGAQRRIRVLETCPLGFKKSLVLVQVGDGALVLGVSGDRIVRLDKLSVPAAAPERPAASGPGATFAQHLARVAERWGSAGRPGEGTP